jgi:hypothetical protein
MLKFLNKHLILWKDIFKFINGPMQNRWYMYMRVLQYWPHCVRQLLSLYSQFYKVIMLETTNVIGEVKRKCKRIFRCLITFVVKIKYLASYAPFTT